jgi:hypothetical protein
MISQVDLTQSSALVISATDLERVPQGINLYTG